MEKVKLIITGDLYPKGSCEQPLTQGREKEVFNDIQSEFKAADYIVSNLETPLSDEAYPIEKDGANLMASPATLKGLKKAGIKAFNLSNNHIMDQGRKGLQSTLNALDENNLAFFGAGINLSAAQEPHIFEVKGIKIGILGFAEHEFSIASKKGAGAAPLMIPDNVRSIQSIKSKVDHLIVLYHGGKEHYPYPTPNQQNISRFYIEQGADAVIAQHSHIVGAYEEYKGKLILYGQGNFLFEKQARNYDTWMEGLLVKFSISKEGMEHEFIPVKQSDSFVGVKKMNNQESIELLSRIKGYAEKVVDPSFVAKEWAKLCEKERLLYQSRLAGHNRYIRFLNKKTGFASWFFPNWKKNMIRNVVECETHREGLETLWKIDDAKNQ